MNCTTQLFLNGKADLIQDHHNKCRDHCKGFLQWKREIGFNFEYSTDKWGFIAKEQGTDQWIENDEEETSGVRGVGVWLNQSEDRPGLSYITWGVVEDEESDQVSRVEGSG